MLDICKTYPGELWLELGWQFLKKDEKDFMDILSKNLSVENNFTVLNWVIDAWLGKDLLKIVGYTPNGSKMSVLRGKYVDEAEFHTMKELVKDNLNKSYFAIGMNLKMETAVVGGCLSSIHIIKVKDDFQVFVYGKVVAFPKKFTADMVLVGELLRELNLPVPSVMVHFKLSSFYYEPIFMRAFVPVFKVDKEEVVRLKLDQTPNFRTSWKRVKEYADKMEGSLEWKNINTQSGMLMTPPIN